MCSKIMIVEDERILAFDLASLLEDEGYEVVAVEADGETAVRTAEETRPDLVLMDIKLQGEMDGVTAAKLIRSVLPAAIVYLTAHSESDLFARAKETVPHGYLAKPVSPNELLNTVRTALYKLEMERSLMESEERYRVLAENALTGIFIHQDGVSSYVNPRLAQIMGYTIEELTGKPVLDPVHPGDKAMMKRITKARIEGKVVPEKHEARLITKDGRTLWADISAKGITYRGRPAIMGYIADITDRKRAERSLVRQAAILESVLEKTGDGICVSRRILDPPQITFTHWNPKIREITGYTMQEINESGWHQTVFSDAETRRRAVDRMERMLKGEDVQSEEWIIRAKTGEKKTVAVSGSAVKDDDGRMHAVVLVRELSDRKTPGEAGDGSDV